MDMLFGILLTVQIIICLCMGALILVQKSEGGALGMGGGPSGFMSARGAGNLLTTLTGWFAFAFFACSIALTVVGNIEHRTTSALENVDTSKLTVQTPAAPAAPTAAEAAASSSSASGPSLSDLPVITAAPQPQAPQLVPAAPAARAPAASPQVNFAPVKWPSASSASASASQKDLNKAKASIWDSKSSSAAPASKAPASAAPASVAPPAQLPVPSAPASN